MSGLARGMGLVRGGPRPAAHLGRVMLSPRDRPTASRTVLRARAEQNVCGAARGLRAGPPALSALEESPQPRWGDGCPSHPCSQVLRAVGPTVAGSHSPAHPLCAVRPGPAGLRSTGGPAVRTSPGRSQWGLAWPEAPSLQPPAQGLTLLPTGWAGSCWGVKGAYFLGPSGVSDCGSWR